MASAPKPTSDVSANGHHASANGGAPKVSDGAPLEGLAESVGHATGEAVRIGQGLLGKAAGRAARSLAKRLQADLDDRDPDYIRENLPLSWLMATIWYRAEVRNLKNVPEEGPVLLVGNHTGGNMAPETISFPLASS